MLVSSVQNIDYGYLGVEVKNILSVYEEKEKLKYFQQKWTHKRNTHEKNNLNNGVPLSKYCDSLFIRYHLYNQNILHNCTYEICCKVTGYEIRSKVKPFRKVTVKLEKSKDEGNNSDKMDVKNENLYITNEKTFFSRFSTGLKTNEYYSGEDVKLENYCGNYSESVTCTSNCSSATTSRIISKDSKMHLPTDDNTNFDIFDFVKCSDGEVTICAKSDCEQDDLTHNQDLVNKYDENLGIDLVKDKDIYCAAENFDSEICPLKNYDTYNENSLLSLSKESVGGESKETFSEEWLRDDNVDYVSQQRDSHVIVPKKTVDITKIKGWRKKQFTVEKCLANKNSVLKKKSDKRKEVSQEEGMEKKDHQNNNYAFVCDMLDEFLDREAELKINYEIPHLYAEYGIKLTSEELVSRPKFKLSTLNNRFAAKIIDKNTLSQNSEYTPSISSQDIKTKEKPSFRTSVIKTQSPKVKCAFPNKWHKNWSVWKENNLSKGKPMSFLKKKMSVKAENTVDFISPCRRSLRISRSAITKTDTGTCPTVNKLKNCAYNRFGVDISEKPSNTISQNLIDFSADYKFQVRKLGMVLYPGPSAPLNPFITYHLQKIRSYRTVIDNKWANFAVSAVVEKGKAIKPKRMVLPLTCCFKCKNEPDVNFEGNCKRETVPISVNSSTPDVIVNTGDKLEMEKMKSPKREENTEVAKGKKRRDSATRYSLDSSLTSKINDSKFDLYEEEIKCGGYNSKDEVDIMDANPVDNSSNNRSFSDDSNLDIVFEKRKQKTTILRCLKENLRNSPEVIDIEDDNDTELSSNVRLSSDSDQTAFNSVMTKLLTKKLNEQKQSDNVTCSIDKLKSMKSNVLELIKLNFIKENYLSGYINLWYVKSSDTGKRRVFLTFSMNPPADGAINLKMMSRCSEIEPPNIIQELITRKKAFDHNDLAILYCNGKHWEIHGSVNFATNKSNFKAVDEKIQVFHLTKKIFPELEILHEVKQKTDRNKVLKWWVMHMMQDFTEIMVKCGDQIGRISRSIIIKTWKRKVPSFIEFKGLHSGRPIGVGINPRLWPYFLIGPYQMGDHHNLMLKLNSKIVPFEYYPPLDTVKPAFLLKRFVSSVIMHSWRNCRQVVGIWLYDRIAMKRSSFLQVRTKLKKNGDYQPNEHDYSLCEPQHVISESKMDCNKKILDRNSLKQTREVFLVPNVPNLGYIKGELHRDQSVTIQHPLKPDRKRNSQRIGDWINRIMKKRVKYVPSDFNVKWEIVKDGELVRNLEPFDRTVLGGTHILCKKGIFYLPSLTKEKLKNLELIESVAVDAIMTNSIVQEVMEVKQPDKILPNNDKCDLPMVHEKLENEEKCMRKWRIAEERRIESLYQQYLELLEKCDFDENSKRTIHFYVTVLLESMTNGGKEVRKSKMKKANVQRLKAISKFLENLELIFSDENVLQTINQVEKSVEGKFESKEPSADEDDEISRGGEENCEADNEKVRELESKIKTLHESLDNMNGDKIKLRKLLTKRLNEMSQHLENMKITHKTKVAIKGGTEVFTEERSHNLHSSLFNNDNKSAKDVKDEVGSDIQHSTVDTNSQNFSFDVKFKTQENNRNIDSMTEHKIKSRTQRALTLLKKYVIGVRQYTEINGSMEIEDDNPCKNSVKEIIVDDSKAESDTCSDYKCNNSKNLEEGSEMVSSDESDVEVLCEKKKGIATEEKSHSDALICLNSKKQVRYKLMTHNSHPFTSISGTVRGRMDYIDACKNGKKILLNKNKRKRERDDDLVKKLRTI